jgi:glutaredoxin 3
MRVDIYTSPTCGYCHQAKRFLSERQIRYSEYDVSQDRDAAERMMNLTGQMGVPVLVIDGQVIVGFDQTRIEELLARAEKTQRGGLGISVADAKTYAARSGAFIGAVKVNSAGERAGLHTGDVIVRINNKPIESAGDVEAVLKTDQEDIVLEFIRDGREMRTLVRAS